MACTADPIEGPSSKGEMFGKTPLEYIVLGIFSPATVAEFFRAN